MIKGLEHLNANGTTVVHYVYDAYGNIVKTDVTSGYANIAAINSYTYRGYRYDSEIGMYYLNSRYYNPEIGRFINSDGLLGLEGDILTTNMYAYAVNNPIMNIDPSGYLRIPTIVAAILIDLIMLAIAPHAFTYLAPLKAWNRWWGKWIAQKAFGHILGLVGKITRALWGFTLSVLGNIQMGLILGVTYLLSLGGIIAVILDIATDNNLDGYITI